MLLVNLCIARLNFSAKSNIEPQESTFQFDSQSTSPIQLYFVIMTKTLIVSAIEVEDQIHECKGMYLIYYDIIVFTFHYIL